MRNNKKALPSYGKSLFHPASGSSAHPSACSIAKTNIPDPNPPPALQHKKPYGLTAGFSLKNK